MPPLSTKLKTIKFPGRRQRGAPLWAGPCGDGPQGGVTQGLIARYLTCPERFRVMVVEGIKPQDRFNPAIEYGQMWHACEEGLARGCLGPDPDGFLKQYCLTLKSRYPMDAEQINHWRTVCNLEFPTYVRYWMTHPDVKDRTPLLQEQPFDVYHELPSGRRVRLRGKWDSVDLIGKGSSRRVYLQENKTKGNINVNQLQRQLKFDLQTMLYTIALRSYCRGTGAVNIDARLRRFLGDVAGIRYNVIRRPSHKKMDNLASDLATEPAHFFMRWRVELIDADYQRFERETLVPVLENLCEDYEWWSHCKMVGLDPFDFQTRLGRGEAGYWVYGPHQARHYRIPYGIRSPLLDGGEGDVDEYLNTGGEAGLQRVDDLFPELKEVA